MARVRWTKWRDVLIYPALVSLGASALASCIGPWSYPPPQTSAAPRLAYVPPPHPARATRKPKPPTTDFATPATTSSSLVQASELIGLDQPTATTLFGAATEQFERPPAMVWRYKNADCELDLFFYLDLRTDQMRTLSYALKGNGGDTAKRQDCVQSLRVARSN